MALVTGIITWPLVGGVKFSSWAMLVLPEVKSLALRLSSAFLIAVWAAADSVPDAQIGSLGIGCDFQSWVYCDGSKM
jgi:hypothetical protein